MPSRRHRNGGVQTPDKVLRDAERVVAWEPKRDHRSHGYPHSHLATHREHRLVSAASTLAWRWQSHIIVTAAFGAWRCATEESQRHKREALFAALVRQLDAAHCAAGISEMSCLRRMEEVLLASALHAWNRAATSQCAVLLALAFAVWRRKMKGSSHEPPLAASHDSEVLCADLAASRRRRRASTSDCHWLGKPAATSCEVFEQHSPKASAQHSSEAEVESAKRHLRGPEKFFYDRSGYTGCARFGGPCIVDKENWPPNLRCSGHTTPGHFDGRVPLAAKNQASVVR
mmetsp:Transcript_22977/g.42271  ORF Transcript_22977/g.42271 Transcript_22977/m.42271 type:complete len:287 (-) Transcript_22977:43-903(-)